MNYKRLRTYGLSNGIIHLIDNKYIVNKPNQSAVDTNLENGSTFRRQNILNYTMLNIVSNR